ncbi:MAG: di-trans,poly-cis-decaprenylcistransferase [Gemmatimonadaceae bacterium]|nr:di-trans,poly-cis-decaprenylcistransferase [Gemmatimonadaceae bacterium]
MNAPLNHVAIIMDGNGRWAARRGRPRWMGHVKGAQVVRDVVAHCARRGVRQLTLYAFSSDNWKRPEAEVRTLFELFVTQLRRQLPSLQRNGIRLSVVGRRDRLPSELLASIAMGERETAGGQRMHLRVAIDYSSREAMATALAVAPRDFGVPQAGTILPPVDLLLRTGGERRLSDFLLWECAYAELAFLDVAFPDLRPTHLDAAFDDFAQRERRFGGIHLHQEGA